MMATSYHKKTDRSRRRMHPLDNHTVSVELGNGKACFQMVLPMHDLLFDVAAGIEQTASDAGLLMMKALIDEEVEQIVGERYAHQADRTAVRWGEQEGHVIFAGRKVGLNRPRVRSVQGREIPLRRYQAFAHPQRMQEAVCQRILRRVSMRDYAGVNAAGPVRLLVRCSADYCLSVEKSPLNSFFDTGSFIDRRKARLDL